MQTIDNRQSRQLTAFRWSLDSDKPVYKVADIGLPQSRPLTVAHRFVINREQRLGNRLRGPMQATANAVSKHDAFSSLLLHGWELANKKGQ